MGWPPTEGELCFADARTIDPYTLPDIDQLPPKPVFAVQQQKNAKIAVVHIEFLCFASNY